MSHEDVSKCGNPLLRFVTWRDFFEKVLVGASFVVVIGCFGNFLLNATLYLVNLAAYMSLVELLLWVGFWLANFYVGYSMKKLAQNEAIKVCSVSSRRCSSSAFSVLNSFPWLGKF